MRGSSWGLIANRPEETGVFDANQKRNFHKSSQYKHDMENIKMNNYAPGYAGSSLRFMEWQGVQERQVGAMKLYAVQTKRKKHNWRAYTKYNIKINQRITNSI
jgi:hypothetical protein